MLLIFCLNLLARGPIRLGMPRAPMQVKTALTMNPVPSITAAILSAMNHA